jgi:hypothetical protein
MFTCKRACAHTNSPLGKYDFVDCGVRKQRAITLSGAICVFDFDITILATSREQIRLGNGVCIEEPI